MKRIKRYTGRSIYYAQIRYDAALQPRIAAIQQFLRGVLGVRPTKNKVCAILLESGLVAMEASITETQTILSHEQAN